MLDSHTHSYYSMDSETPSDDMVERAIDLGLRYLAITDHYNGDYDEIIEPFRADSKELKYPLDIEGHIADVERLRGKYGDKIYVACGMECGYTRKADEKYLDTIDTAKFDVLINSIHMLDRGDIYDDRLYIGKSRDYILHRYLEAIRESIDARYNYNIVAHIGYVARKAPYPNSVITWEEFPDEIDDILRAIIARDKCLECNAKSKSLPVEFLPGLTIAKRYYELGGRRISYGSDAHSPRRICDKYDAMRAMLKDVGFEGFTYYVKGEPQLEKF